MADQARGAKGFFAAALPEKRIFIQTADGTRYLRMGPGAQASLAGGALLLSGWLVAATAVAVADFVAADGEVGRTVVLHEAYQARLAELVEERDLRAAEALSAQNRFQTAMEKIGRQQSDLLVAIEERRELSAALDLMRTRLQETAAQRDAVTAANDALVAQMDAVNATLANGTSDGDLKVTLAAVTAALSQAVVARDAAQADRASLDAELGKAELALKIAERRQDEMLAQLEQAVATSFGPLEGLLEKADIDVDSALASVRAAYSGQGGPLVPVGVSSRGVAGPPEETRRFDELMIDIDRMNLLRLAIGKVPYAMPVKDPHRFTSGFGYRRDPKGRGRRMHTGVDFAAPKGTPIYATADGIVTSAGSESGYGKTIRIRHEFGFETLYAHQTRLYVEEGQRVSRGEHIGDMGATGRSTGVHLHYEIRVNGRPVNPMTFVEAAKDVF